MRHIKWTLQRLFRGYSDIDVWNLDTYLAKVIIKPLKAFRKLDKHGFPASPGRKMDINSTDDWNNTLDQMIEAFQIILDDETDLYLGYTSDEIRERDKSVNRGLKLFSKYFRNLWD